ncbi:MAG: recombinase family protein [Anaerolineae bacterium]|nr:recombinase family protein [Anaerolineae bacterium]
MPGPRKYKPPQSDEPSPVQFGVLPTNRPIAVYYRQSTMGQVGNISTDMQQIDLPRYVMSLGWQQDLIIPIDEDEGVSGTKTIDERIGMSRLFDLIITRKIGAVAVQAEDRLFRDETQIQVNVFIDACVKNDIRVLTPYFKYNFADKHEGPYHRLLFRMRAEQAADFLNSYIRGRLHAARERMLIQGMWMGGPINLGFMVDDRKILPGGTPNPNWRKFQPFPPCAEVVVRIFETFIMLGGNRSATQRYLLENGPHFPDLDDPELMRQVPPGFYWKKPVRMLKRRGIYTVGSVALPNMLTNAVYLGHWVFKDQVVQWNNHPPIVTEDLFYQAFNYLSPYNLDGTPNEDHTPRLSYKHSTKKKKRDAYEPIYLGLVGSYYNGQWRNATAVWSTSSRAYAYAVNYRDDADIYQHLWSRRCDYFDKIINEMLFTKLQATFEPEVWNDVLGNATDDFHKERRMLQHQLQTVEQKMASLLDNFSYVQSQTLAQALERQFSEHEQEKVRLERKLNDLQQRIDQQESLIELAQKIDNVLQKWQKLGVLEKRGVAQMFIEQIVVTQAEKYRVADVKILWKDESADEFVLPWSAERWTLWLPAEVETLRQLLENNATQVEMAEALPDRNWRAIRIKIYEIIGKRSFYISPKPVRDEERYADYIARMERTGWNPPRHSGSRWIEEEIQQLDELLDKGATQLELCAALPHRSWAKIRRKITQLRGKEFKVTKPPVRMGKHDTIKDYLERHPELGAVAMNSSVSENCPRH